MFSGQATRTIVHQVQTGRCRQIVIELVSDAIQSQTIVRDDGTGTRETTTLGSFSHARTDELLLLLLLTEDITDEIFDITQ